MLRHGAVANYPIALAPGMEKISLRSNRGRIYFRRDEGKLAVAMGVIFISGVIFIVISLFRVRETIVEVIPDP